MTARPALAIGISTPSPPHERRHRILRKQEVEEGRERSRKVEEGRGRSRKVEEGRGILERLRNLRKSRNMRKVEEFEKGRGI